MAKDTNFKFGKHVPTDSPDTTPDKFWTLGVVRVTWPHKFWALNANSSKMSKDTNF